MIQRTSLPTLIYSTYGFNRASDSDSGLSGTDISVSIEEIHTTLVAEWQRQDPFWSTIPTHHADISHVANSSQAPTIMQIRAFSNELEFPPHQLERKLFVIWRLDEASIAAQNALLKNLEEPPAYADIIITVKNPAWVLETIQSRSKSVKIDISSAISQYLQSQNLQSQYLQSQNVQSQTGQRDNLQKTENTSQTIKAMLSKKFWQLQTVGELSQIANTYKTKEVALQFLDQFTHQLISHPSYPQPFMTTALDQAQQAYFRIKANANVGLQLENCFFSIKQACWQS
jgi:hypothetical protein